MDKVAQDNVFIHFLSMHGGWCSALLTIFLGTFTCQLIKLPMGELLARQDTFWQALQGLSCRGENRASII